MANAANLISLIGISLLCSCVSAQELKTVVRDHIDVVVKATKDQLGIPVKVQGESGYTIPTAANDTDNNNGSVRTTTGPSGVNLTFVISARDLEQNIDGFVKISFRSDEFNGSFGNIGTTESDTGTNHPDWTQPFWFYWKKGTGQNWTFRLFDHANGDTLVSEVTLDVDSYVEQGQDVSLDLQNGTGKILVQKTTPVKFKLSAKNIKRADEFNGKSDPYVKVYFRTSANGTDKKFYTTTTIDNVENADWGDVVEFTNYQRGKDQYLHFKLRDADSWTKDDHLGEVLVEADTIFIPKVPQTMYLEKSGEHSTLTIIPLVPRN